MSFRESSSTLFHSKFSSSDFLSSFSIYKSFPIWDTNYTTPQNYNYTSNTMENVVEKLTEKYKMKYTRKEMKLRKRIGVDQEKLKALKSRSQVVHPEEIDHEVDPIFHPPESSRGATIINICVPVPASEKEWITMVQQINRVYSMSEFRKRDRPFKVWEESIEATFSHEAQDISGFQFAFKHNARYVCWREIRRSADSIANFMNNPDEWRNRKQKSFLRRSFSACLDPCPTLPFTLKMLLKEMVRLESDGLGGYGVDSPRY